MVVVDDILASRNRPAGQVCGGRQRRISCISPGQNKDGSFSAEWDKNDPMWSFLNGKTSKEIQDMIENVMKYEAKRR